METVEKDVTQEAQAAPAKLVRAMEASRFRECDYERTVYVATAFEDTAVEDMLKPGYWVHVASKMKPWDRIEARANDGTWWAEFMVLEAGRAFARVVLMRQQNLTTTDVAQSQISVWKEYKVLHRGPHCKWSVIRVSDKQVLHEGEGLRDGAENWLKNHLVALSK